VGSTNAQIRLNAGGDSYNSKVEFTKLDDLKGQIRYMHAPLGIDEIMSFRVNYVDTLFLRNSKVGIGTSSPVNSLHVMTGNGEEGNISPVSQNVALFQRNQTAGFHSLITVASGTDAEAGIMFTDKDASWMGGVRYSNSGDYMRFLVNGADKMRINSSGNVGIGTGGTDPVSKLTIMNGGIAVDRSVAVATGNIDISGSYLTNGADYAELFPIADSCKLYQLVSLTKDKKIKPAVKGDTFVLGVISENPSILGNSSLADDQPDSVKPVALMGRVKALVNGEVSFGDWLTASSRSLVILPRQNLKMKR